MTDFMAKTIKPQLGEKVADFACGTGGFLTSWLNELSKQVVTAEDQQEYATSIYGIEKKPFPYTLCITNMLLHGIDVPMVYHESIAGKGANYSEYGSDIQHRWIHMALH